MATKPIPLHKALRNLEKAYGDKCAQLDAANKRIAELEQQAKEKHDLPLN